MRPILPRTVQGDVVRARLAALLAEWGPPDEPGGDAPATSARPPSVTPARAAPARAAPRTSEDLLRRAWAFGRAHAAVVGVIGLVALVGAVWAITQARTVPVAIAAPTPVAPTAATPTPSPTPEPLRVHVLGAVAAPGVVRVPPGARVEDALAAAGGLTDRARPGELNLAAPVVDGSQIVVGDADDPGGEVRPEGGAAAGGPAGASGGASGAALDLNSATLAQLDALPGVGPVTAQAILAWRQQHDRFSRVEELLEVDGIGPKTFERLEPHVRV